MSILVKVQGDTLVLSINKYEVNVAAADSRNLRNFST